MHLWLVVHGMVGDSQTVDEGVHLAAGVSYWRTGDFRLNPEHPVLWKLVAALPVLALHPTVPTDDPSWAAHDEWTFADRFMHENRVPTMRLLLLGRLATALAGAALVLTVFWLGKRLFSAGCGLIAAGLTAFDPNVIAHARYITTDLPVTLMIVVTITQLYRFVHAPSPRTLATLAIAVVAALLTKFSALYLLFVLPLLLVLARRKYILAWSVRRTMATVLVASLLGIVASYGFHLQRIGDDPRVDQVLRQRQDIINAGRVEQQPAVARWLIRHTNDGDPLRAAIEWVKTVPVPGYWYVRGISAVVSRSYWGSYTFAFGQLSDHGFPWYFPATWLVKTPLPIILLLVVTLTTVVMTYGARRKRFPAAYWFLIIPAGLYVALTFTSRLNLGVRHLLPIYPFLAIAIGSIWSLPALRTRLLRIGMILILLSVPLSTLSAHPTEIAYFSEWTGGTANGHRYLSDSNLDWGQDLLRLRTFLSEHAIRDLALDYAGTARPDRYGVRAQKIDRERPPTSGLVAVSIGNLIAVPESYQWLAQAQVVGRAGASIILFRLD
ncbi:MAG: glycosyltransferase family 39 protein [Candidatus Kerfeldbacteria bacterium]|nr:glycosyltransferase family 39 protein [Candidatus Kerfeldbacteria bacterium]